MGIEIEKKYLVKPNWRDYIDVSKCWSEHIHQGYLTDGISPTIRVRVSNDKGYIAIKSKNIGITRNEYEYQIPVDDACDLLDMCEHTIAKMRCVFTDEHNQRWEIDVFKQNLEGLVIAEIELQSENQQVIPPEWIDVDISTDFRYTNLSLSTHPEGVNYEHV